MTKNEKINFLLERGIQMEAQMQNLEILAGIYALRLEANNLSTDVSDDDVKEYYDRLQPPTAVPNCF